MLAFYCTLIEDQQEKDKFTVIYERYRQSMFKFAFSIVQDEFRAEDAVHDAFLYILKTLKSIENPNAPQTQSLVLKVVKNVALNMCRSRKRERHAVERMEKAAWDSIVTQEDILADMEEKETESSLRSYLLSLPEEDQELLKLYYFTKIPAEELASLYHVTKKTIYNRLHKIQKDIQEKMKEEGTLD